MWQRRINKRDEQRDAFWPKPRTRDGWLHRRRHNAEMIAVEAERVRRAPWLHAEQVRLAVISPRPEGLPERTDRRRRLAERLLAELAYPPYGRPGLGNDFVATVAVPTTVDDAPGARETLTEAAQILAGTQRDEVRITNDPDARGMWMRVHGTAGSVVFAFLPTRRSVFVCVDDLPANCWQISDDTAESSQLISDMYRAVIVGWNVDRPEIPTALPNV